MAQGKELGTNFMQQHAYSLGLQAHPEKGLIYELNKISLSCFDDRLYSQMNMGFTEKFHRFLHKM